MSATGAAGDPACRVCSSVVRTLGVMRVLGRHDPRLHQCGSCGFVQTDPPWWLDEAYSQPITSADVGLLARCQRLAGRTRGVLACAGALDGPVLDWGGGYGTLTRMLRDRGVDCRHWDPHTQNVFAQGLEAALGDRDRWTAVLASEVLEHLPDPWSFFLPAAARTDLIVATTTLVSVPAPAIGAWHYWSPEHGQHVSFYSLRSMEVIAARLGMRYVPAGQLHVFARGMGAVRRAVLRVSALRRAAAACRRRRPLIGRDHDAALQRLAAAAASAERVSGTKNVGT